MRLLDWMPPQPHPYLAFNTIFFIGCKPPFRVPVDAQGHISIRPPLANECIMSVLENKQKTVGCFNLADNFAKIRQNTTEPISARVAGCNLIVIKHKILSSVKQ